jgi:hypothetical protein
MSDLVTPLLMTLAGSALESGRRRGAHGVLVFSELALAALLGLGAVACLAAALWIFLIPHAGPVGAPLVVASVLSIAALVMALLPRLGRRPTAPQRPALDPAVLAEITGVLKDHKGSALFVAVVAGLAAGSYHR